VSSHLLLEAAVRSLVMGAIIFAALRLLRIDQVRARRTAWLLALVGALVMPLLVGAQIGPRLLPEIALADAPEAEQPAPARYIAASAPWAAIAPPHETSVAGEVDRSTEFIRNAASLLVIGYCVIAVMLSLRLCTGIGFALRLRSQAERIVLSFDPQLDVRTSLRIASPVTIASSVLLPASYSTWDDSTMRIVLAHERAHVRQGDFYVHLLAGMHCALFWFNPFSWWLRRQLSELGEALSDRAAVKQAVSRASYAELLLAFASRARRPLSGVAMASTSNLTPRIERLLSDRGFERSFSERRGLSFVAAGMVVLAMVASTSLTRVRAESSDGPLLANAATDTIAHGDVDEGDSATGAHDEVLAIHTGKSRIAIDSGKLLPAQAGDYIYFQHDGKPYLIQDPHIIAQARALLAPMEELGREQKALGEQQALLGAKRRALATEQRAVKIDSPDFKREVEEIQNTIKHANLAEVSAEIDQKTLAELQSHLGEIQSRVGALQSELDLQESRFGEKEGELGVQQGKLGEQLAHLAEQRQKIVEDVRSQLKPLIEQAIRDGKGKASGP